ncbi:Ig-like domain-containing protein, partial [Brucella intermedia]|nr:Ig-like domain-containing protein [Brucella intermedia]
VAITDPEGDNIPTASGTTEPGSTVVVTWPDGTTSQVTADGTTGAWTATAPAEQPDGNVTVAVTDPAGNPGTGSGTWTPSDSAATPTVTAEVVFADAAGNDAAPVTGTQTYTVDVTAPTTDVAITDPEGDNVPTASGTTEPGSTVVVTWPDGTTSQV